ncbi:MAG: DUF2505 family protein [Polyangiaceae bacterium]
MIHFTLTHEIDCAAEAFWSTFFSKEFNDALYKTELAFPEFNVLKLDKLDGDTHREVDALPKLAMPPVVMKLLGNGFRYREEGTLDRAKLTYNWKIIQYARGTKLPDGFVKIESINEKRCRRIVDITIEAKIFGVGGIVESSTRRPTAMRREKGAAFCEDSMPPPRRPEHRTPALRATPLNAFAFGEEQRRLDARARLAPLL